MKVLCLHTRKTGEHFFSAQKALLSSISNASLMILSFYFTFNISRVDSLLLIASEALRWIFSNMAIEHYIIIASNMVIYIHWISFSWQAGPPLSSRTFIANIKNSTAKCSDTIILFCVKDLTRVNKFCNKMHLHANMSLNFFSPSSSSSSSSSASNFFQPWSLASIQKSPIRIEWHSHSKCRVCILFVSRGLCG